MQQQLDTPKIWQDEEELEAQTNMPVVQEEPKAVLAPTPDEQEEMLKSLTPILNEKDKELLSNIVTMSKTAAFLDRIGYNETIEQRRTYIDAMCTSFVGARMENNRMAENLRAQLLARLASNIDNIDLQTAAQIYIDLQTVMAQDTATAMTAAQMGSANMLGGNQTGVPQIVINNATTEGASITNNNATLNATPQQVRNLKETVNVNNAVRTWNNAPMPNRNNNQ